MALTRKLLTALGIDADKQDQIIEAHTETVEGLKNQIAQYKANAEELPKVKEQLEAAKEAAKNSGDAAKIQEAFDAYKAEVAAEKTKAAKKAVLSKIAKDAGLSEAGIAKVLKYSDYAAIELDEKGEAKDGKGLLKSLKEEWPEYIQTTEKKGADVPNPPAGGGKTSEELDGMSDADYYKATYVASKQKG